MNRCAFIVTSIVNIPRCAPRQHPQKRDQFYQSGFRERKSATHRKESKHGKAGNNYISGKACGYLDYHVKVTFTMLQNASSSAIGHIAYTGAQGGLSLVMYISLKARVLLWVLFKSNH